MKQFEKIREVREKGKKGILSFYPYNLKGYSKHVSGMIIEPSIITANSSGGKSSKMKFLYLLKGVELAIEKGYNYVNLLFALEDDLLIIRHTVLCYLYFQKYQEIIDIKLLVGAKFSKNGDIIYLSDDQQKKIDSLESLVEKFMSYIIVFDDIYTVSEIHKKVLEFAFDNGEFYNKGVILTKHQLLNGGKYDTYKKTTCEFVNVIVDHVGLLNEDDGEKNLYDSIGNLSKVGKQVFVKKLQFHWLMVQQQSEETNDLEHIKANYFQPTIQGLSDRKSTGKDARLVLTISNPSKYGLKTYNGYDLLLMKGFYSSWGVAKQTYGATGINFNLLFLPHCCTFWLLPIVAKGEQVPEDTMEFIKSILTKIKEYDDL